MSSSEAESVIVNALKSDNRAYFVQKVNNTLQKCDPRTIKQDKVFLQSGHQTCSYSDFNKAIKGECDIYHIKISIRHLRHEHFIEISHICKNIH